MSIVVFKSKAAGEILMFRESAEVIFKTIGKPLGLRGVLTPEEMPAAIKVLQNEIEKEKVLIQKLRKKEDREFKESKVLVENEDEDEKKKKKPSVFFSQRAFPLLEMMEYSLKEDVPVTWGI